MLHSARPGWLLAALSLQAATYLCVTTGWKIVLTAAGTPELITRLFPIAVGKRFADQVVPIAGMSRNVFVVDRLTGFGVKRDPPASRIQLIRAALHPKAEVLSQEVETSGHRHA